MTVPNFLTRVVARVGLSANVKAFITGELAWIRDTKTFAVGDDTAAPPRIPTTKSTDAFDFSAAEKFVLPGGVVFDRTKTGLVDGVGLKQLNAGNGFLARTADGKFEARLVTSSDQSIMVENADGGAGSLNLKLNPDSAATSAIAVKVIVSPTAPANPKVGQMWFDNDESVLYIYIVQDTDNKFWLSLT